MSRRTGTVALCLTLGLLSRSEAQPRPFRPQREDPEALPPLALG